MTEIFDESSRVDYAGGAYGGFWSMQEPDGRPLARPDGGVLRKWSSFWPDDWTQSDIEAATAEAWQHAKANGRLDTFGFTGIGAGFRVRAWLDGQGLIAVAYPSFWPPVVDGAVGTIVRSVSVRENVFVSVDVPKAYDVLGLLLSLDFAGTQVSPYAEVRELARRGVDEQFVGGESTDSFSVEVNGARATIESLYRDDLTAELPTRELLTALDEFASWAG